MKIKPRIILWFIILVISINIVTALISIIRLDRDLYYRLVNRVKTNSNNIQRSISHLVKNTDVIINKEIIKSIITKDNESKIFIQIYDSKNHIIAKSSNFTDLNFPKNTTDEITEFYINNNNEKFISYSTKILIPNSYLVLQVSTPMSQKNDEINKLIKTEVIETFISLIISIFLGVFFSSKILKPISNIIEQVENIDPKDFDKRIDTLNFTNDEIGKIADTLNKLLEKNSRFNQSQIRFIADASHELRSPVTTILGNAQILQKRGSNDPNLVTKNSMVIVKESERLISLINDLIYLAQTNAKNLKKERFDINSLIKEIVNSLQTGNPETAFIFQIKQDNPIYVYGSPEYLKKSIANIINNSLISISTLPIQVNANILKDNVTDQKIDFLTNENKSVNTENGLVEIYLNIEKNNVSITIKDNGSGIPEDSIDQIFDPFYKVDTSRKKNKSGSGLGLSIVSEVIRLHDGSISVESSINKGTTFTVEIPTVA